MDTSEKIAFLKRFKGLLEKAIKEDPTVRKSVPTRVEINGMIEHAEKICVEVKRLKKPPYFPSGMDFSLAHLDKPNPFSSLSVEEEYFNEPANFAISILDWAIRVLKVQKSTGIIPNQAFIAMRIKKDGKPEDDILQAIKDAARRAGITAEWVDEKPNDNNNPITDEIRKSIEEAEYVIADLTDSRPNVYYEAGYAHALEKMMVFLVVEEQAEEVGFNLKGYKLIYYDYDNAADLRSKLRKQLEGLKAAKDAKQSG